MRRAGEAESYFNGLPCNTMRTTSVSCSGTCLANMQRFWLGLGVEYSSSPCGDENAQCVQEIQPTDSGDVVSIPGKHFVFGKTYIPGGSDYAC